MARHENGQPVTIILSSDEGERITCSALLHQDPHHLKWNRLSLLGAHDDMLDLMRTDVGGAVQWSLFVNPDWPDMGGDYQTSGRGFVRSTGMTSGLNIALDSIQTFADIDLFEISENISGPGWTRTAAHFWFLQRPVGWYPNRRRLTPRPELSAYGDWRKVAKLGIRFRFATIGHARHDPRVSRETELIEIPSLDIEPLSAPDAATFPALAEDIWFSLRIFLTFRYRQMITPLMESHERAGGLDQTWHVVAVEPRTLRSDHDSEPFYGAVDEIFARVLPTLHELKPQRELLHGAAWGYAESFRGAVTESALTSVVEALERLVCAYEEINGLSRDLVGRAAWKPVAKILKAAVDGIELDADLKARIKRGLAFPATLSLQERLERMADNYRANWTSEDRALLEGLPAMIKARNDIVHGRVVADLEPVYVELVRARAIFERLFLDVIGCKKRDLSGWANLIVSQARPPVGASAGEADASSA
jgi:hypothetical protein